jgi:CHAT domain-containing protein
VVPDGALTGLPLGVLVTERRRPPSKRADYRAVGWLARDYAITVLPAVLSLRALRLFAARNRAAKPFIGFGDPRLERDPSGTRGVNFAALVGGRGLVADVAEVRKLAPLPATAQELNAIAQALGASAANVYLGERASEPGVRGARLAPTTGSSPSRRTAWWRGTWRGFRNRPWC